MDKVWGWINSKFQHPLSLVFFILGALLILLGVSTGFDMPLLKKLAPEATYRPISLALGVACCMVAAIIYYRPPTQLIDKETPVPEELKASFVVRRASLSEKQGQILSFLQVKSFPNQYIDQEQLGSMFNEYSRSELYYRLEHLRLLGFLESQRVGQNADGSGRYAYRMSAAYKKELGDFGSFLPYT